MYAACSPLSCSILVIWGLHNRCVWQPVISELCRRFQSTSTASMGRDA